MVEIIAEKSKECAILIDLGVEGKKLYSILAQDLQYYSVGIDNSFRNFLFKETQLRQIEGLVTYIKNIE